MGPLSYLGLLKGSHQIPMVGSHHIGFRVIDPQKPEWKKRGRRRPERL
jgi:hypothetical protein